MRDTINWARLLAFVTGLVNQELLLQNEYLAAENRILRAHLPCRLQLSDPERCTLAEIGKRPGRKRLKQVACTAKPDTILAWYRRLIARKFDTLLGGQKLLRNDVVSPLRMTRCALRSITPPSLLPQAGSRPFRTGAWRPGTLAELHERALLQEQLLFGV